MCRLLLANRDGVLALHEKLKTYTPARGKQTVYIGGKSYYRINYPNGLLDHLQDLEDTLGGHGNGVVLIKNGEVIYTLKGMKVSVEDTFKPMLEKDYDYAVWHTRLCSSGTQTDKNCHPFVAEHEKNQLVWAMNGTETSMTKLGELMGGIIDTEAIGLQALKLGLPIPKAFEMYHSVFVGTYNGKPFAVKNGGDLERFRAGKAWVFVSKLPHGLGDTLGYNYVYDNGKETASPVTTGYSKSYYYGGDYEYGGADYYGTHYTQKRASTYKYAGDLKPNEDYPDFRNFAYKSGKKSEPSLFPEPIAESTTDVVSTTTDTKQLTLEEVEETPGLFETLSVTEKNRLINDYLEREQIVLNTEIGKMLPGG